MSFYGRIRNVIFKIDSEKSHNIATRLMKIPTKIICLESFVARRYCKIYDNLEQELHGLHFYNPIGLASGFDKNAELIKPLMSLGFSYLELGSVTQIPQSGNPKPRIFRHIEEESLQNAMGFNNIGARGVLANLKANYPCRIPIGVNIGKNKDVVLADSLKNYELSLDTLKNHGDYFAFNLSSPNTPGLRDLQNESFVKELLAMAKGITDKPLFIKISPDMDIDSMLRVCESAIDSGVSGIIATNTTIDYGVISKPVQKDGENFGGISGRALSNKSREVLKILAKHFFNKTTLISSGGVHDASEAYTRIRLGASLVQVLSAMIYHGPSLVSDINKELASKLESDGFKNIKEAIGVDIK